MKMQTTALHPLPRPRFRMFNLLACIAFLAAQLTLLPNAAHADVTATGAEVGGNVVFSYSGSVDLTGFTAAGTTAAGNFVHPARAWFVSNPTGILPIALYTVSSVPAVPFGTGLASPATHLSSGDVFVIAPDIGQLGLPVGYVSGASLAGSVTFTGATFASLGVFGTGTYTNVITPNFTFIVTFGPPPEQFSAMQTGLPFANAMGPMLISAGGTVTNDINNHLFNLLAGDGEEAASDGSIAASLDDGVIVGQGDGPDNPIARKVRRSRQWEVFTTVNYGNVKLNAIGGQAGVQVDAWAPGVGIERHLSRGLAVGFAASFLHSEQSYTNGLGSLRLDGPALSAYISYVRKDFWNSLLYSFGTYELDSSRNPGFGFPVASGSTRTYTNAVQYNTGWNFRFQNNTLVTGPFAGIDWLHGTVDAYSESGGGAAALSYGRQSYESLVTRVGWAISKKIRTNWSLITPQVRLSYERQNLKNNGTSVSLINAPFSASGGNQSPGQDYMVAGAGVSFAFNNRCSLLLSYQGQFFRNHQQAHFGSVRIGWGF